MTSGETTGLSGSVSTTPTRRGSWRRSLAYLLLILGVLGIVVVCQGVVFRIAYDSSFSTRGAAIVSIVGIGMAAIGWRLFVPPRPPSILPVGLLLCFLGIGMALPPFRAPGLSRFEFTDFAIVLSGLASYCVGLSLLYRNRNATGGDAV